MKKVLLSGVKPTGRLHIGNYFGAMKQFVELQNSGDYKCYFFIADYHGLNFIHDRNEMKRLTLDLALDYMTIGLDPSESILFKQSDISAHTELAWIFDTIITMPYLMRAHAYKDAETRNNEINVGTFNYPVLMAADILLYDTDVVPVGSDQKQHVEYARDIAEKFNRIFNETFKLPEPLIVEGVATVPGIDGKKMSKSHGNVISLFSTTDEISKAVMGIVTDSDAGIPINVYNIHKLFVNDSELKKFYDENAGKYKILKERLVSDIDTFMKPLREKRAEIASDKSTVIRILDLGARRANETAAAKMAAVKKAIGVI